MCRPIYIPVGLYNYSCYVFKSSHNKKIALAIPIIVPTKHSDFYSRKEITVLFFTFVVISSFSVKHISAVFSPDFYSRKQITVIFYYICRSRSLK